MFRNFLLVALCVAPAMCSAASTRHETRQLLSLRSQQAQLMQEALSGTQSDGSCPASSVFGFNGGCLVVPSPSQIATRGSVACKILSKIGCDFWTHTVDPVISAFGPVIDNLAGSPPSACMGDFTASALIADNSGGLAAAGCDALPFSPTAGGRFGVFGATFTIPTAVQSMLVPFSLWKAAGVGDPVEVQFCAAVQDSPSCLGNFAMGLSLNDGAFTTLINVIPDPEQTTAAVLAVVADLIEVGLEQVTIALSTVNGGFARQVTVYGPQGYVSGSVNINYDTSFSGGFALDFLPEQVADIFRVTGTFTRSFAFSGNPAAMVETMLNPVSGGTARDRGRAARALLAGQTQLVTASGGVQIGLADLTGNLLQDLTLDLGEIVLAIFGNRAGSGTLDLSPGMYFMSNAGLDLGSLVDTVCSQFDGLLDLMGTGCPNIKGGSRSTIGMFVTSSSLGFRFDGLGNLVDFSCTVSSLFSKPKVKCSIGGSLFQIFAEAAEFVVHQLENLIDDVGKEIARLDKTIARSGFSKSIVKTYNKAGKDLIKFGNQVAGTATQVGNQIGGTATQVVNQVAGTATQVGNQVAGTATQVGNQIANTGSSVVNTVDKGATKLGKDISKGAKKFFGRRR